MKNIRLLLFSAVAGICFLTSCSKDNLHRTNHPDHAKVSLKTEWGTGAGATIPYIVNYNRVGSEDIITEEGQYLIHDIKGLLEPGTYHVELYSKPVEGTGFNKLEGQDVIEVIEDPENPGFIYANPAVFFSGRQDFTVEKDRDYEIITPLYQQMRKLVIHVYLANDPIIYTSQNPGGSFRELKNIEATLKGVANRFDFMENIYSGSSTVKLPFRIRNTPDNKMRYLESVVTLVGFNETAVQEFTLGFDFNFGEQRPKVEEDFHALLFDRDEDRGDFNDYDKKQINDTIIRQIVMPITAGGEAIIQDYDEESEGNIIIDEDTFKYKVGDLWPADSETKEGIVVWVASQPESSRGIVMSLKQSDAIGWGQAAELPKYQTVNEVKDSVRDASTGLIQWETTNVYGNLNTQGIATYLTEHLTRTKYESKYTAVDFPAYEWVRTNFTPDWFLPSVFEFKYVESIPNINNILASAGQTELVDENGNPVTLWTSQTEPVLKDKPWHDETRPEYDSSLIYIWNPVNGLKTTHAGTLNPAYDPEWQPNDPPQPDDPLTNPERPLILNTYYTRAFRYF